MSGTAVMAHLLLAEESFTWGSPSVDLEINV